MKTFDLVIIGGGPAGYSGAIRAAQLGLKVACVEKMTSLGGTCLNVGCIPSKTLLHFSEQYQKAHLLYPTIGINASVKLDLRQMLDKKAEIINDLSKGINLLFTKNKITKFHGVGKIIDNDIVEINNNDVLEKIKAEKILLATGSEPVSIEGIDIDEEMIVSSTGALSLKCVPKRMIVIGGGYIGLELGSVWKRFGSNVKVVEYANSILPALDEDVTKILKKSLEKQGVEFLLGSKVTQIKKHNEELKINIVYNNQESNLSCDIVLIAVGRKANIQNLSSPQLNIKMSNTNLVEVNDKFQTSIPNIYAVGDLIKGPMLAHKAEQEAIAAIENMVGKAGYINYNLIPSVIYTDPEVATIGFSEKELKNKGITYKVGRFPFFANSRARSILSTEGMVKIIADKRTDRVLGASIVGHEAGTLIAEIVAFMEFGGSAEDIAKSCHAHPTLSEAIKEAAALASEGQTIHI